MRAPTLVVLVSISLTGCKSGLPKMPDLSEVLPKARFGRMDVEHVDFQKLDGKFVLEVENPYPLGLDLAKSSWKLGLAGHPFLDGTNEEGTTIAAAETSKVRIPFSMAFVDTLRVAGELADDADTVPYTLDVDFAFKTPAGPVGVPLHEEGEMPALHTPQIRLQALRIERLDVLKNQASLALDLNVHSDQPSAISFDTFGWGLKLAGNNVASGATTIGVIEGDQRVTLPIDLDLLGIGTTVVEALTQKTPMKVRLTADAQVGTPFGVVPLAIDEIADLTPR